MGKMGVLHGDQHGLIIPCFKSLSITGKIFLMASDFRGYCFPRGQWSICFKSTFTGMTLAACLICPCVNTSKLTQLRMFGEFIPFQVLVCLVTRPWARPPNFGEIVFLFCLVPSLLRPLVLIICSSWGEEQGILANIENNVLMFLILFHRSGALENFWSLLYWYSFYITCSSLKSFLSGYLTPGMWHQYGAKIQHALLPLLRFPGVLLGRWGQVAWSQLRNPMAPSHLICSHGKLPWLGLVGSLPSLGLVWTISMLFSSVVAHWVGPNFIGGLLVQWWGPGSLTHGIFFSFRWPRADWRATNSRVSCLYISWSSFISSVISLVLGTLKATSTNCTELVSGPTINF